MVLQPVLRCFILQEAIKVGIKQNCIMGCCCSGGNGTWFMQNGQYKETYYTARNCSLWYYTQMALCSCIPLQVHNALIKHCKHQPQCDHVYNNIKTVVFYGHAHGLLHIGVAHNSILLYAHLKHILAHIHILASRFFFNFVVFYLKIRNTVGWKCKRNEEAETTQ